MYPKVPARGPIPGQFDSLQPFVDAGWAAPERRERTEKRLASTYDELKSLYDALAPQLVPMLEYLDRFPLERLDDPQTRLLQLTFAAAEVRNAVENWGQSDAIDGWDTRRFIIHEPVLVPRA